MRTRPYIVQQAVLRGDHQLLVTMGRSSGRTRARRVNRQKALQARLDLLIDKECQQRDREANLHICPIDSSEEKDIE